MEILIVFVILGLAEFGYLYFQWSKISDVVEIGTAVAKEVPLKPKYSSVVIAVRKFLSKFKKLIWVPIIIVLIINFLVSLIIGGLAMAILALL